MSHDPNDYQEPTNAERADRIPAAILAHQRGMGAGPRQAATEIKEDPRSAAVDMLTDLHHWCDARGLDFYHVARMARDHHETERRQELEKAKATRAPSAEVRRP